MQVLKHEMRDLLRSKAMNQKKHSLSDCDVRNAGSLVRGGKVIKCWFFSPFLIYKRRPEVFL